MFEYDRLSGAALCLTAVSVTFQHDITFINIYDKDNETPASMH